MNYQYTFTLKKIVKRLTPPFLRNTFSLAWLESLNKPFETVYNEFTNYRNQKRIELAYNSQTIMFEKLLNDKYDPVLRRIKLSNSIETSLYTYLSEEGQEPIYLFNIVEDETPVYLNYEGENSTDLTDTDFRVFYPLTMSGSTSQIKSSIETYRLAGKTYQMITT
jgi:hypothetical protein